MPPTTRPNVFIGSSTEGLDIAKAIQVNLDRVCESVIWHQGVFGLSDGTLETLVGEASNFDFAILALTPDDTVLSRQESKLAPRDNVLFELGLFMGTLGRARTFIVYDRTAGIKIPSDLAGVTSADYQKHANGNLVASLGSACTRIENAIIELGRRGRHTSSTDINQLSHFQVLADLLDLSAVQFIILMHESGRSLKKDRFDIGVAYTYSMKNRSAGSGHFSIRKLCELLPEAGLLTINLVDDVSLTPRGQEFARWLANSGRKAEYFRSEIALWGNAPADVEKWYADVKKAKDDWVNRSAMGHFFPGSLPIPESSSDGAGMPKVKRQTKSNNAKSK